MTKYGIIIVGSLLSLAIIVSIIIVWGLGLFSGSSQPSQNPYISDEPYQPVAELYEDLCATDDPSCTPSLADTAGPSDVSSASGSTQSVSSGSLVFPSSPDESLSL